MPTIFQNRWVTGQNNAVYITYPLGFGDEKDNLLFPAPFRPAITANSGRTLIVSFILKDKHIVLALYPPPLKSLYSFYLYD